MASAKTQPARGMRDFLPADVRKREYVIGVIKEVYERYGFEPLETPAVENIETLMGKYGEEGNQLIFKILKRGEHEKTGEADLALRYDLTVPLARVVAQYQNELPKFFKRYQIQPVWRADRPARGRFREFYQCDVDVLGSKSMVVEAELITAASDALVALGFNDFTIRLNHRQLMDANMTEAMIAPENRAHVLGVLDKRDKIGEEGVRNGLSALGVSEDSIRTIFHRLDNRTSLDQTGKAGFAELSVEASTANRQILGGQLRSFNYLPSENPAKVAASHAIFELNKILELTEDTRVARHIRMDPSLARGLSYYTGTIMEINVEGIGSLGGGGRYDNLVGMFLGKDVPACGFSLGLERIIVVMSERKMFPPELISSPADVMVLIWYHKDKDEKMEAARESLSLAQELRSSGLRVDVYPVRNVKVSTQIAYAAKRQFPFVAFVGENERQSGLVSIKDLRSGEQSSLSPAGAIEHIKAGTRKDHAESSPQ